MSAYRDRRVALNVQLIDAFVCSKFKAVSDFLLENLERELENDHVGTDFALQKLVDAVVFDLTL